MKGLLPALALSAASVSFAATWTASNGRTSNWYDVDSGDDAVLEYYFSSQRAGIFVEIEANSAGSQNAGLAYNYEEDGTVQTLTSGAGVCITYRAAHHFRMDLIQSSITNGNYYGYEVPAADEYTALYIPYADLSQESWGTTTTWSTSNHVALQFAYKGSYATTDSTNSIELAYFETEVTACSDAATEAIPATGATLGDLESGRFFDASETSPTSAVNEFGGAFTTYTTGSSTISDVSDFLSDEGTVGFTATLAGSSYPTAGLTMAWSSSSDTADLSSQEGLCIVYSSASGARLQLLQAGMEGNYNYFGYDLDSASSYTLVDLAFSDLVQEEYWGYDAVLDVARSTGLQFEFKGSAGDEGGIEILELGWKGNCSVPTYSPEVVESYAAEIATEITEDDTLKIVLSELFTDRDDDELTYKALLENADPSGVVTQSISNDTLYIIPAQNTSGTVDVTIKATDDDGNSVSYSFSLTVTDVDHAPSANDDSYEVDEDCTLEVAADEGVLANDEHKDGLDFSISSYTEPSNGTLTFDSETGAFTYVPEADYYGTDSFTYTLEDENDSTATATVTITVNSVNDAPTVTVTLENDTIATLDEDFGSADVTVALSSIVFSDKESSSFTYSVTTDSLISASVSATSSSYWFEFESVENANGVAEVVLYGKDGDGDSVGVTLYVVINAVADAPVANDDAYEAKEDTLLEVSAAEGVLANDEDPDGEGTESWVVVLVSTTSNGTLTLAEDGSFTYLSDEDYSGEDSFTYQIQYGDDGELSEVATVTIIVAESNDAPYVVVEEGSLDTTVTEDFTTTLTYKASVITALFEDPEGDELSYSVEVAGGKLTATLTSANALQIKAVKDSCGSEVVTITASDGELTASFDINITITPVNDSPTKVSLDTILVESSGWSYEFLLDTLFSDADGDELEYTITNTSSGLTADIADGVLTIAVEEDTELSDGTYRVSVRATDPSSKYTTLVIYFTVGEASSDDTEALSPKFALAKTNWREALLASKGTAKVYDLRGKLLFRSELPVNASEVQSVVQKCAGNAILRVNGSTWLLSPNRTLK